MCCLYGGLEGCRCLEGCSDPGTSDMSMESQWYCCCSAAHFEQKSSECLAVFSLFSQWGQIEYCPIKAWCEAVEVSLLSLS